MKKISDSSRKKHVRVAIIAASLALSMTACGSTSNTEKTQVVDEIVETQTTDNSARTTENADKTQEKEQGNRENGYFGQITAIEDNTITVTVMNGRGGGKMGGGKPTGEIPDGEKPDEEMPTGEMPDGEKPDREMPSGERPDGEMPAGEIPNAEMPDGEMPSEMVSETMTIEVTASTVITVNDAVADISALEVGNDIMFTVDGEQAVTITVGMPKQNTATE